MERDPKICTNCGFSNNPEYSFCSECGTKLEDRQLAEVHEDLKDTEVLLEETPEEDFPPQVTEVVKTVKKKRSKKPLLVILILLIAIGGLAVYILKFAGLHFSEEKLRQAVIEDLSSDNQEFLLGELRKDKSLEEETINNFAKSLEDYQYRNRVLIELEYGGKNDIAIVKENSFFVIPSYKVKLVPVDVNVNPNELKKVADLSLSGIELEEQQLLYPGEYKISYKVPYELEGIEPDVINEKIAISNIGVEKVVLKLLENYETYKLVGDSPHSKLVYRGRTLDVTQGDGLTVFLRKNEPIYFELSTPGGMVYSDEIKPVEGIENFFEMRGKSVKGSKETDIVKHNGVDKGTVASYKDFDYFVAPIEDGDNYQVVDPNKAKTPPVKEKASDSKKEDKEEDKKETQKSPSGDGRTIDGESYTKEDIINTIFKLSYDEQLAVDNWFDPPYAMIYPGSQAEARAVESVNSRKNNPAPVRFVLTRIEVDEDSIIFFEAGGHHFVQLDQYTYYFMRSESGDGDGQVAKWRDMLIYNPTKKMWQLYSATVIDSMGPNRKILYYDQ